MRLLLDTHALLWWFTDDDRLSDTARRAIADEANEVFVSTASAWEAAPAVAFDVATGTYLAVVRGHAL